MPEVIKELEFEKIKKKGDSIKKGGNPLTVLQEVEGSDQSGKDIQLRKTPLPDMVKPLNKTDLRQIEKDKPVDSGKLS